MNSADYSPSSFWDKFGMPTSKKLAMWYEPLKYRFHSSFNSSTEWKKNIFLYFIFISHIGVAIGLISYFLLKNNIQSSFLWIFLSAGILVLITPLWILFRFRIVIYEKGIERTINGRGCMVWDYPTFWNWSEIQWCSIIKKSYNNKEFNVFAIKAIYSTLSTELKVCEYGIPSEICNSVVQILKEKNIYKEPSEVLEEISKSPSNASSIFSKI